MTQNNILCHQYEWFLILAGQLNIPAASAEYQETMEGVEGNLGNRTVPCQILGYMPKDQV